jgi:hypothetical protein
MLASGCSAAKPAHHGRPTGWAPKPADTGGLRTLAAAGPDGFTLHTAGGERHFLAGVNLGSTTPLHQPGEVSTISRAHFRRWIAEMSELGIRAVRVYTLLPPAFYDELRKHNERRPDDPLYLVQGVYLPDESYLEEGRTLYTKAIDQAFADEIADISAAVHGDFFRPPMRGRASGRYTADVSPWVASWIIGVEWDGEATLRADKEMTSAPAHIGRYFRSTPDASPTERWLAKHMDALATAEAKRGVSVPIAFVNWPTADPLKHPTEPLEREDLVGVDAMHVLSTTAWPSGTFASFHVYPYYPDFQRYEPGLEKTRWRGAPDRYAGYLTRLRDHFSGTMPLLVTEFGVPSSLGNAHNGLRGRDQGGHTEREAMAIDADLLRLISHLKLGGGFVFAWSDEWFKPTWNTTDHQLAGRRQLWHDPLTNEQWFGLIATDSKPVVDASTEQTYKRGAVKYIHVWADASWVHIELAFRSNAPRRFKLGADVIPGRERIDYRVKVDGDTATLQVRRDLDPIRLDNGDRPYRAGANAPWHTYALITNRAYHEAGHPAELQIVGKLERGVTWTRSKDALTFKLPWSMLGMADPSSRTALGEGMPATMVKIPGISFALVTGHEHVTHTFRWEPWNFTRYTERRKAGLGKLAAALRDVSR